MNELTDLMNVLYLLMGKLGQYLYTVLKPFLENPWLRSLLRPEIQQILTELESHPKMVSAKEFTVSNHDE